MGCEKNEKSITSHYSVPKMQNFNLTNLLILNIHPGARTLSLSLSLPAFLSLLALLLIRSNTVIRSSIRPTCSLCHRRVTSLTLRESKLQNSNGDRELPVQRESIVRAKPSRRQSLRGKCSQDVSAELNRAINRGVPRYYR